MSEERRERGGRGEHGGGRTRERLLTGQSCCMVSKTRERLLTAQSCCMVSPRLSCLLCKPNLPTIFWRGEKQLLLPVPSSHELLMVHHSSSPAVQKEVLHTTPAVNTTPAQRLLAKILLAELEKSHTLLAIAKNKPAPAHGRKDGEDKGPRVRKLGCLRRETN